MAELNNGPSIILPQTGRLWLPLQNPALGRGLSLPCAGLQLLVLHKQGDAVFCGPAAGPSGAQSAQVWSLTWLVLQAGALGLFRHVSSPPCQLSISQSVLIPVTTESEELVMARLK